MVKAKAKVKAKRKAKVKVKAIGKTPARLKAKDTVNRIGITEKDIRQKARVQKDPIGVGDEPVWPQHRIPIVGNPTGKPKAKVKAKAKSTEELPLSANNIETNAFHGKQDNVRKETVAITGIIQIARPFKKVNAHVARVANTDICPRVLLPRTPGVTPSRRRYRR